MTIRSFIIHPEWRREGIGTEADVVGVRFPHRREMMGRPLVDDSWFSDYDRHLLLVIAEVKTGHCDLNGPWTNLERHNVEKVLAAIGVYPKVKLDSVAGGLYQDGVHQKGDHVAALVAFGSREGR